MQCKNKMYVNKMYVYMLSLQQEMSLRQIVAL